MNDSDSLTPNEQVQKDLNTKHNIRIDKTLDQLLNQYESEEFFTLQSYTYQKIISNNYHSYVAYFKDIELDVNNHINLRENDHKSMASHKITLLKNSQIIEESYQTPIINIIGYQLDGLIFQYEIIIGKFKLQLNLINLQRNAPLNILKIGEGGYGQIYKVNYNNKSAIVAKRTYFSQVRSIILKQEGQTWELTSYRKQIESVICQLSFNKICSFFQIGPKVQSHFGFDLVCYDNAIEFFIEYCFQPNYYPSSGLIDIKKCIRSIHKLQIIHKDIKPSNILYSFEFQKYVVSDFGITHFVKQELGQYSSTYQQGSWNFMSKQMKSIKKGKCGYIDLYYNDMFGLQQTINELKQSYFQVEKMPQKQDYIFIDQIEVSKTHQIIHIFSLIKNKKYQELIENFQRAESQIVLYQQKDLFAMIFQNPQFKEVFQHPSLSKYKHIYQLCLDESDNKKNKHKLTIQFLVRCYSITAQLINGLGLVEMDNPLINKVIGYIASNYESNQLLKVSVRPSTIQKQIQLIKMLDFYKKMQRKNKKINYNFKIIIIISQILLLKLQKVYQISKDQIDTLFSEFKQRLTTQNNYEDLLYMLDMIEILRIVRFRQMNISLIDKKVNEFKQKYSEKRLQLYELLVYIYITHHKLQQIYKYAKILYIQYGKQKKLQKMIFYTNKMVQICYAMQKKQELLKYIPELKEFITQYLYIHQVNRNFNHEAYVIECLIYLGNIQNRINNFDSAIQYLHKALKMVQKINYYKDIECQASILIMIGNLYIQKNMIQTAQEYILKSLDYSSMKLSLNLMNECYEKLCQINLIKKNPQKFIFYFNKLILRLSDIQKSSSSINQLFNRKKTILNITLLMTKQYLQTLYQYIKTISKQKDLQRYNQLQSIAIPNFYHYFTILQIQYALIGRIEPYAKQQCQKLLISKLKDQFAIKFETQEECIQIYIQSQILLFKKNIIPMKDYALFLTNIEDMIKICPIITKRKYLFQLYTFTCFIFIQSNDMKMANAYLTKVHTYLFSKQGLKQMNIFTNQAAKNVFASLLYTNSLKCFENGQRQRTIYYIKILIQILKTDHKINQLYHKIYQCYLALKVSKKSIIYLKKYIKTSLKIQPKIYEELKQIYRISNKKMEFYIIKTYLKICTQNEEEVVCEDEKICLQLYNTTIRFKGTSELLKSIKYYKRHLKIARQLSNIFELNIQFVLEVIQFIRNKLK